MNKFMALGSVLFVISSISYAADSKANRTPANVGNPTKMVTCTVRIPAEGTEKTFSGKLVDFSKSGASATENFGDYTAAAYWDEKNKILTAGVTDNPSGSTASTFATTAGQVAHLFVSKPNKSLQLDCYFQ